MCFECDDYLDEWYYLNEWDDERYDPIVFPDYYEQMLAAMETDDDGDFMPDEPAAVIDLLREAKWSRINADSFVHNTRRDGARTRSYYKRQARRQERQAGSEMLRSF